MREIDNKIIIPPCLNKGDMIGLVAPAGPIHENVFSQGVAMLRDAGLTPNYSDTILQRDNYLAGSDQRRAKELHELWLNPAVKAIMAVRGGYGSSRILENLDFKMMQQTPKIFIGFSDVTILLNVIFKNTGIVTFHGPMLSTLVRDGRDALTPFLESLSKPFQEEIRPKNLEIIRAGTAKGRIIGGNMTSIIHLLSTSHEPDWSGSILMLEDVHEPAYRLDRMLTHLKQAGCLDKLSGVILGDFLDADLNCQDDIELIWNRVISLTGEHQPVWANFPSGHGDRNIVLPLGAHATMDSNRGVLQF